MGSNYTTQGDTGYNASPPPDDGTTGTDNKLTWAKHTGKLTDPIRARAVAMEAAMVAYVDWDTLAKTGAYTTVADDNNRVIECSSSPTITLGAPATMLKGYTVCVKCVSGTTTVNTGGNEVDGSSSNRTLTAGQYEIYRVNAAEGDWLLTGTNFPNTTGQVLTSPVINTGVSGTAIDTDGTLAANSDTLLASQKATKTYVDTSLSTKVETFTSSAYTSFTTGVQAAKSHGLSGIPQNVSAYFKCTSVSGGLNHGYAVGDIVFPAHDVGAATDTGIQCWASSSQVGASIEAGGVYTMDKSTGATANVANANWDLYITAQYFT